MTQLISSLLCLLFMATQPKPSETCLPLGSTTKKHLISFVITKYRLGGATDLSLKDDGLVAGSCYRKLMLQSTVPQIRQITLYLSPDQKYLTPFLYDLREDPYLEAKEVAARCRAALGADPSPVLGNTEAPITIVIFSDFECPYCKPMAELIERETRNSPKGVRLVFKNLPLSMHAWAERAAESAACAAQQSNDTFWQLHDYLFANQASLSTTNIVKRIDLFVRNHTDLDANEYAGCLKSGSGKRLVNRDRELAGRLGVNSTPTIFINGVRTRGIRNSQDLKMWIDNVATGNVVR